MLLLIFTNIAIVAYAKRRLKKPGDGASLKRLRSTLWGSWGAASLALVTELSVAFADLVELPEDQKESALRHAISNLGAWEIVPGIATLGALLWLLFWPQQRSPQ